MIEGVRIKSVVPLWAIAKEFKVKPEEIMTAFHSWGCDGYDRDYRYALGDNRFLRIWNFHKDDLVLNDTGSLQLVKKHGKSYRVIDGLVRSYHLGAVA